MVSTIGVTGRPALPWQMISLAVCSSLALPGAISRSSVGRMHPGKRALSHSDHLRALANGAHLTVDTENDKNAVIALREIAEKTIEPRDVREGFIHAMQNQAEVDEPESTAVPTLPEVDCPTLGSDDPSIDTVVDAMTEEDLLRRMRVLAPMNAKTMGGGGIEG